MAKDFEKQMSELREKTAIMMERARLAEARAALSRSNLDYQKSLAEMNELKNSSSS